MTNTAAPPTDAAIFKALADSKGRRLAEEADRSQALADALAHLATLVSTDPTLAAIRGTFYEERIRAGVAEYQEDAEDRRSRARDAGWR